MSTLLNCWEGVRKGGGGGRGGGDLHYSLDITSFLKDLTQKLSILFSQIRTMTCPDIVKSFFANPEKDISITNTLSNLFFCKSRANTCSVHTLCQIFFFANHEQRHVHYKHIVKSFFANRERRHVHYKHIVKPFFCNSRTKTCSVQTLCQIIFFVNHELKDMSITNLKTHQERKTLGMILSTIRKVERL
jgi:hypothetical protein